MAQREAVARGPVRGAGAGEVPARRFFSRERLAEVRPEHVLFGAIFLLVLLLIIPPVLTLFRTSFFVGERPGRPGELSLGAYQEILTSPYLRDVTGSTLLFSIGSTVAGLILGGGLAWCTERTNAPFKQLVYASTFVSFAVPGILRTIGWIFLLGPNSGTLNVLYRNAIGSPDAVLLSAFSMGAMILVEGVFWIPLVFLMMSASFKSMDPSLEEAASMSGANVFQTLRRITIRLALPGILSVLFLTFIRSIQAFEVPLLLGVPARIRVFTTEVYMSVQSRMVPDYAYSSAYGVLLLGLLAGCIWLYGFATRRTNQFATVTGKGFRPRVTDLGPYRTLAGAFILFVVALQFLPVIYLMVASFLPTLGLDRPFWEALTTRNYQVVLNNPIILRSLQNSVVIAVTSATVVVSVTAVMAWVMIRTRVPGRQVLDQIVSLPLVFPGIVMGVAILVLYLRSPIPVYGTIWILVIAYVTSYLPYGMRYAHPGLLRIHPELEESAQISGASWGKMFLRIVLPLLLPALFAGWIFVFLISLRELSVAALLYTSQSPVVATTMLDLWENGNVNQVSAFGAIIAVFSIAVSISAYRFSRRYGIQQA